MKIKILSVLIAVMAFTNIEAQIKVQNTGYLNMGNTSNEYLVLDYSGYNGSGLAIYPTNTGSAYLGKSNKCFNRMYAYNMWAYNYNNLSDSRSKENIKSIGNALSLIKKLNGVQFDYKLSVFVNDTAKISSKEKATLNKNRKNYLGFIAQDVQKVLPQIVFYDDSTDIYSMDYTKLIPVLVEAIKEQQTKIDELTELVNGSSSNFKSQKDAVDLDVTDGLVSYLAQNAPNPFNQSTEIAYCLPESTQKAMLNIYDMNGVQIKSIGIAQKGKGSITIQASELNPGMYMYSLIADGKEIDTKRMILTE